MHDRCPCPNCIPKASRGILAKVAGVVIAVALLAGVVRAAAALSSVITAVFVVTALVAVTGVVVVARMVFAPLRTPRATVKAPPVRAVTARRVLALPAVVVDPAVEAAKAEAQQAR